MKLNSTHIRALRFCDMLISDILRSHHEQKERDKLMAVRGKIIETKNFLCDIVSQGVIDFGLKEQK